RGRRRVCARRRAGQGSSGGRGGVWYHARHSPRSPRAMFDFLKKKPAKDDAAAPATPPAPRKTYSPEEPAPALDPVQEEKAARIALEREQTREAMKETVGGSLLARSF